MRKINADAVQTLAFCPISSRGKRSYAIRNVRRDRAWKTFGQTFEFNEKSWWTEGGVFPGKLASRFRNWIPSTFERTGTQLRDDSITHSTVWILLPRLKEDPPRFSIWRERYFKTRCFNRLVTHVENLLPRIATFSQFWHIAYRTSSRTFFWSNRENFVQCMYAPF